jgi:hypothetical protein
LTIVNSQFSIPDCQAPAWDRLPASEQQAIREAVLSKNRHVQKIPKLLHRLCLDELARRRAPQGVPG